MRPVGLAGPDALPAIPRKPSFAAPTPSNPRSNIPTSFILARESELESQSEPPKREDPSPPTVCSLEEAISGVSSPAERSSGEEESRRRRSTIKPAPESLPRSFSAPRQDTPAVSEPLTPLLLASPGDISLPSSPKSVSSRSLQNIDIGSVSDEGGSQAILSSGEEEEENTPEIQDSAPQLIMPSIKMPSRRPFTAKGRELGRLKILVTGTKGSGKTSLIKSIVQICEDIVHVDPLDSAATTPAASTFIDRHHSNHFQIAEIYASTKPYPTWWSNFEESRVLRRRKSVGDAVLERNICFVDTAPSKSGDHLVYYMESQIQNAISSVSNASGDFITLMGGGGGPQVDLVLYLVCKDTLTHDIEIISTLSELSNVIPLIAKGDSFTEEDISNIKDEVRTALTNRSIRSFSFPRSEEEDDTDTQPPYAVSAALSPDTETMDASLLMSPDYIQPLVSSQLPYLIKKLFDKDNFAFLRHSAASKLAHWRGKHPVPMDSVHITRSGSPQPSTIGSPGLTSVSASGVLVPYASDISLTTSNSYTLARISDHTHREERLAQVRLAKWASDLQHSLNRERERYEKLARGERALWLVEKMNEEVKDGRLQVRDKSPARSIKSELDYTPPSHIDMNLAFATNDPMGLLRWNDEIRTRGWVALQVVGSFGVIGGLALWLAKTWGFNNPTQSVTEHSTDWPWKW